MKRGLVAAGVAALLLLTGCTGIQSQETIAVNSADPTSETAAPLTAETPAASTQTGDAAFLEEVRAELRPDNVIPNATDEQLLEAGREACERRAAGEPSDTISVIDGEEAVHGYFRDSLQIVQAAADNLC